MRHFEQHPNEISRESLVQILEIMHRLAAPVAMPELLREIIEVGKVAIVAEYGVLWLLERSSRELLMVVPSSKTPVRLQTGEGLAGRCATSKNISNIHDTSRSALYLDNPVIIQGFEPASVLNVPILGSDEDVLGVMQWLGAHRGQFDEHDEWVGPTLAAQCAVAIQHSRMTHELLANAILNREVTVAREIQLSTLPDKMPRLDGYDLHAYFKPTNHTGGDLYDLVMLDGRLFMLLGDATGHGFGPALSATQMQAMLRVSFRLHASLDEAYIQVNNQLDEDLPDDRFITAFVGFLDPISHEVEYHSAGQGPILHYRASKNECDWYKPTSFPMGVMQLDQSGTAMKLRLEPGDILGLISDGVYEYADSKGQEFGENGVAQVIAAHHNQSMAELGQRLIDSAAAFGGGTAQADDITLVLVKRLEYV